jgi:hypothetical protein
MAAPRRAQQIATKRTLIEKLREFVRDLDDFCDIPILPFTPVNFETALSPRIIVIKKLLVGIPAGECQRAKYS